MKIKKYKCEIRDKKIINVFILLVIALSLTAQKKEMQTAVKKGTSSSLIYSASFKNYKVEKERKIYDWASSNGYIIKNIAYQYVERFGGATQKMVSTVNFRSKVDQAYIDAKDRNTTSAYFSFLDKYPNSKHKSSVESKFLQSISSIKTCKYYVSHYPSLKTKLVDKAFTIATYSGKSSSFSDYLYYFPDTKNQKSAEEKICEFSSSVASCNSYSKKYPQLSTCLEERAYNLVSNSNTLANYSDFLLEYDDSKFVPVVSKKFMAKANTLQECSSYSKKLSILSTDLNNKAYKIAQDGSLERRKEFLKLFPKHERYVVIKKLVYDEETAIAAQKAEEERIKKENAKITALKLQKAEMIRKRNQKLAREERKRKVDANSIPSQWKLGDKVCSVSNYEGPIQGLIDHFNEDRSNMKVKILGGPGGYYDAQEIIKDETIWTSTDKWYECIGDENVDYSLQSKKEQVIATQPSKNKSDYSYDHSVGDFVTCSTYEKESGWEGTVVNKADGKYQVELTRVIVNGWFSTSLNPGPCSGNKRLSYDDANYGTTYIWVPDYCID